MKELKQMVIDHIMSQEDISSWMIGESKYFGPSTRSLLFATDVNSDSTSVLISQLLHLEALDEESQITLYLNTEGGSLTDGLAIYDCITSLSCPVVIIATGLCASAGLLILSAGDYRAATPNTTFFYHQPILGDSHINSTADMESLNKHYAYCREKADGIIKKRTKMKKQIWDKNFKDKTSFYFTPEEAIEFKFIDKIMPSRKVKFTVEEA